MLLSEYQMENRKAIISRFGDVYAVDLFVDSKFIQKLHTRRITEAEELAENFVHEGTKPIFLSE